jgi:hypothetical protein
MLQLPDDVGGGKNSNVCSGKSRMEAASLQSVACSSQTVQTSLGHMILNGSRMTDKGLKISYHIIYPWLIFPCNTIALHNEVGSNCLSMSEMPQFQYSMANGERKSFIDPGVYTGNWQFRLLLCIKLSDWSLTALCLQPYHCFFDHASPTLVITSG